MIIYNNEKNIQKKKINKKIWARKKLGKLVEYFQADCRIYFSKILALAFDLKKGVRKQIQGAKSTGGRWGGA